jgi:anti-sigma regulatory factor (Ser/Thr protein kinase)
MSIAPLRVPATLDSLGLIGEFVLRAAAEGGLDRRAAYRLRLAVDEIATNVVVHGRPGEHGGDDAITVHAAIEEADVVITLEDEGPAFSPIDQQAPHHIERPVDERPIGGLGVFLAVRGVDQFRYERVDNRNRNIFVVHRAHPSVDAG